MAAVETRATPPTPEIPASSTQAPKIPVLTSPPGSLSQEMTEEFMDLVNAHRSSLGLRRLNHDEKLGEIAEAHSKDMASKAVPFGHSGFSERCSEAKSAMGRGNYCSENVAMGQKTVQAAFKSWMNSPGHRKNIEQSRSTHTGFGFKKNSSGTYYWTQLFLEVN